jgi:hypothetical protein
MRDPRETGRRAGREPGEEGGALSHTKAEALRLRTALEDIVALALSGTDAQQRVVLMQRRAIAALTGPERAGNRHLGGAR